MATYLLVSEQYRRSHTSKVELEAPFNYLSTGYIHNSGVPTFLF